jgi:hypothetical protein
MILKVDMHLGGGSHCLYKDTSQLSLPEIEENNKNQSRNSQWSRSEIATS